MQNKLSMQGLGNLRLQPQPNEQHTHTICLFCVYVTWWSLHEFLHTNTITEKKGGATAHTNETKLPREKASHMFG